MKYKIELTYNAVKTYEIEARSMPEAHKKAYNIFMDSCLEEIFEESSIDTENFGVETKILGKDGTDMLHL